MPNDPNARQPERHMPPIRREGYEISYLAKRHGITPSQARGLVSEYGSDWTKLDQAARALKKS
ncbi:hypothetical protein [Chelatococcus reniformis]|uniref:DUF3606 domain-containing protein n=1 Tax=Chelatococcus reniformis TaxID=1494448 RepID=A0A916U207_9HYPH|nr:hypothetical protein [Chelatococcus reniformis]GGC53688.1 hypothetical protein GCM10010994_10860 [Chelatococcus reniformis]